MTEKPESVTNPQQLTSAYDEWYMQWATDTNLDTGLFPWHDAALRASNDDFAGASVVDIGCGAGRLTHELVVRGAAKVSAIDLSEVALGIARRRCADVQLHVNFQQGDIEQIPSPASSFDFAFCCDTIEHVLHPRAALAELHRVLKPTGVLILTTPNHMSVLGMRRVAIRLRGERYSEGGQPVNNLTSWPRTRWWLYRTGFQIQGRVGNIFGDLTAVRAAKQ